MENCSRGERERVKRVIRRLLISRPQPGVRRSRQRVDDWNSIERAFIITSTSQVPITDLVIRQLPNANGV